MSCVCVDLLGIQVTCGKGGARSVLQKAAQNETRRGEGLEHHDLGHEIGVAGHQGEGGNDAQGRADSSQSSRHVVQQSVVISPGCLGLESGR